MFASSLSGYQYLGPSHTKKSGKDTMNDTHDLPDGPESPLGVGAVKSWATSRRRFLAISGLAVGGAAIGLGAAGCGTAQTGNQQGTAKGRAGAAGEVLFVSGMQWGPPTSFNPFGAVIAFPANWNQTQLIYESLLRFNLLDGSLQPGLGKELQEPDANTFVVPLQEGTKWQRRLRADRRGRRLHLRAGQGERRSTSPTFGPTSTRSRPPTRAASSSS